MISRRIRRGQLWLCWRRLNASAPSIEYVREGNVWFGLVWSGLVWFGLAMNMKSRVRVRHNPCVLQISAEAMTEVGEPKEAICEAVKKHDIQLLVLGSHGRGAIQR